jgi:gliding motility-associated-like protein
MRGGFERIFKSRNLCKPVSILLLLCTGYLSAQNETSIWYFGQNAGLDFNSGNPVALTNGALDTLEGCATIADSSGNLLFYTDGTTIWNRNHAPMMNGTGLNGDSSSTQSAIVVPNPANDNLFYVFTVDSSLNISNGVHNGLQYSVVDMRLDNGLGAVTNEKNVQLEPLVAEKLTAIKKPNLDEYWVIAHRYGNNEFVAYEINSSGIINNPVVSAEGLVIRGFSSPTGSGGDFGQMKISPEGSHLAMACGERLNDVQVFDFDVFSGRVSNPVTLYSDLGNPFAPYGLEFSPNSNLLYFTITGQGIYQFDLSGATPTDWINSRYDVKIQSTGFAGMQLALDGKIYIARNGQFDLDAIAQPNVAGSGCMFQEDAVNLGGRRSRSGLPPFIQSSFNFPPIEYSGSCAGFPTSFNLSDPVPSVTWDFGDPGSGANNTSTAANPSHTYNQPGSYTVTAQTTDTTGQIVTQSIQLEIFETPTPVGVIDDILLCTPDTAPVVDLTQYDTEILGSNDSNVFEVIYYESQANANADNPIPNPTSYTISTTSAPIVLWAIVSNRRNSSCSTTVSFEIIVQNIPNSLLPLPDLEFCDNESVGSADDGRILIDLSVQDMPLLNGSDPTSFTITYFTDALRSQPILNPDAYINSLPVENIYVLLESVINPDCFIETQFEVIVKPRPTANPVQDRNACSDNSQASFDTTNIENELLDGQVNVEVAYRDEAGNMLPSPLPNPFTSEATTITATVTSNLDSTCSDSTTFDLSVLENPIISLEEEYTICENSELVLDLGNDFDSIRWSTGATSSSLEIDRSGQYDVSVEKVYPEGSCSSTFDFVVLEAETITIREVVIGNFTSSRSRVEIIATGQSELLYSLDGIVFQASPVFENVSSGIFELTIKDTSGCQTVQQEIVVLNYPRFFTPNGDGFNDRWNINLSDIGVSGTIEILDRYGRLLKQQSTEGSGWDGTSAGQDLPSSDYWFILKYDSEIIKGHFTLKR